MTESTTVTPLNDRRSSLAPQSTPIRYRGSSKAFHSITPSRSTSVANLEVLGKKPVACKTRVEQLEIELLMALDALSMIPDSDDESEENTAEDSLFQNGSHQYEELQSRYNLSRENYKTELWNREFEPVLERIRAAADATTNDDLEENAKSEAMRRLRACGCIVQKEKYVLEGLLAECMRMGAILGDVKLFLETLSGAGEHRGPWSYDLYGTCDNTDTAATQNLEHDTKTVAANIFNAELLETTLKSDFKTETGSIDLRAYCDHIFTSLQNLHFNSTEDIPATFPNNTSAACAVSAPLITYLYAAVTENIAAAHLQAENTSLRATMDRDRKILDATLAEVQCRNEEDLSLAAGLLIETVQVQAEVERVRAAARADLGVSAKLREEIVRRKGFD